MTCQNQKEADNNHESTPSSSTQDTRSIIEDQDQKETMLLRRKRPHRISSDDDDDQDDTDDGYQTTQSTSNAQNRALPARVEFDRIILEETLRVNPFRAPHGTKKHAWKQVADNVKAKRSGSGSDASMTGVYVRNRVYYLINTPKASAELEQLRRKVIEEKNNSEGSVVQRSSRSSVSSSSDVLASPNTPNPVTVQQHQQRQSLVFPTTPIPGQAHPRLSISLNHSAALAPSISSSSRMSSDHQLEQRWRYLESRTQYLEQRTQYLEPRLAALETATTNLFALFSDHQTSIHDQLQQINGVSEP